MEKKFIILHGAKQQWYPCVHVKDLMGIYMHALLNSNVRGVLNAVTPEPVRKHELSRFNFAIAAALRKHLVGYPNILEYFNDTNGSKVVPWKTVEDGYEFLFEKPPTSAYICDCEDITEV